MKQLIRWILFLAFCLLFLWLTVFSRNPADHRTLKLELLWAYRAWIAGKSYGRAESIQNVLNILAFIPYGFLFPKKSWKILIISVLVFSSGIELIQYIWVLGWCEIDDVICNTLGAVLGFLLWKWLTRLKGNRDETRKETGHL